MSPCLPQFRMMVNETNQSMQDLIKLPSFPRKALEADLDLYHNGQMGKVGIAHEGEKSPV